MPPPKSGFTLTPEQEASKLRFFRRQFFDEARLVTRHEADLKGQTAIVTGANGGIGLQCARQLFDLGLTTLILAVRDEAKGQEAREQFVENYDLENGRRVEVWPLDYASYDSVQAFARRAEALPRRVDMVVLNAGVHRKQLQMIESTGHEEDFQVNYLSTVLLMTLFLGIFRRAQPAAARPGRIVLVSSEMAAWAKFNERKSDPMFPAFDDPDQGDWNNFERYSTTKLLGQLFVAELAKRVPPSLAVVNCCNPGLCYGSSLAKELGTSVSYFERIVGRHVAIGARSLVHAAVRFGEKGHGQYIEDGQIRPMSPFVYSSEADETTQHLWRETMNELNFASAEDTINSLKHYWEIGAVKHRK